MEIENTPVTVTGTGITDQCIANLSEEQLKTILEEHKQMLADLKTLKTNIFRVSETLGLLNDDGSFKEKPKMSHLIGKIMGVLTNSDALKRDFGFITELLPMLARYEHL